jgi:hypothetical protein
MMIKDIIFFNNFGLYSQCELEATKRGQKLARFIADCVEAHSAKENEARTFRNKRELFIYCQSKSENVAEFIEACCAEYFGAIMKPKKKGSILDLNRDA